MTNLLCSGVRGGGLRDTTTSQARGTSLLIPAIPIELSSCRCHHCPHNRSAAITISRCFAISPPSTIAIVMAPLSHRPLHHRHHHPTHSHCQIAVSHDVAVSQPFPIAAALPLPIAAAIIHCNHNAAHHDHAANPLSIAPPPTHRKHVTIIAISHRRHCCSGNCHHDCTVVTLLIALPPLSPIAIMRMPLPFPIVTPSIAHYCHRCPL